MALMALEIPEEIERAGTTSVFKEGKHNSGEHLHAVIESLRMKSVDASLWITNLSIRKVPTAELVSESYPAEGPKLLTF